MTGGSIGGGISSPSACRAGTTVATASAINNRFMVMPFAWLARVRSRHARARSAGGS